MIFSPQAELQLRAQAHAWARLREFICDVLAQDPRPAYHRRAMPAPGDYAADLLDFNVRWRVSETTAEVIAIDAVSGGGNDAAGLNPGPEPERRRRCPRGNGLNFPPVLLAASGRW